MKILLVCCLAISGALSFPQNDIQDKYAFTEDNHVITNAIEDYDLNTQKTSYYPDMSIPLLLYKQVMGLKPEQMLSIANMVKPFIKPILTSIELHILTEFVDETLRLFKDDPQVKASLVEGVDSLQSMYENSNGEMLEQFLTWIVSLYSDEQTARSFSSLMSDISPALRNWVVDPMRQYYRSYITPTLLSLTKTLNSFFGEDLINNEIARSGRWSSIVDIYIDRLSEMTSQANHIMKETADFLEKQDTETN